MPLPAGTRYRMKKIKGGYERLAFNKAGKVIEAKNMQSGATHTPAEFSAEKRHKTALSGRR